MLSSAPTGSPKIESSVEGNMIVMIVQDTVCSSHYTYAMNTDCSMLMMIRDSRFCPKSRLSPMINASARVAGGEWLTKHLILSRQQSFSCGLDANAIVMCIPLSHVPYVAKIMHLLQ